MTTTEYVVNDMANHMGCASPDSPTSPGAVWLTHIHDAVVEAYENGQFDGQDDDVVFELADGIVPTYTAEVWGAFVDVAGYSEVDDTNTMQAGEDMTDFAKRIMFSMAETAIRGWVEERLEIDAHEDNDDTEDEDDA